MPLFDFLCLDCGHVTETLVSGTKETVSCSKCGGNQLKKLLSAHSSLAGKSRQVMPGTGDTACCGSTPGHASGCAGPGSCCGKGPA